MMDNNSLTRLSYVHPTLAKKIKILYEMLGQESIEIRVTQGFRTWAQQHALYLQGRANLIDVNACRLNCGWAAIPDDQNHRVTNADAGYSWHNYGLAVDVAPFKNGFPVWDEQDPMWARIVAVGESLGLRSGLSWQDEPHFEYTGIFGPEPDDEVRTIYQAANDAGSGSTAVWEAAKIDA